METLGLNRSLSAGSGGPAREEGQAHMGLKEANCLPGSAPWSCERGTSMIWGRQGAGQTARSPGTLLGLPSACRPPPPRAAARTVRGAPAARDDWPAHSKQSPRTKGAFRKTEQSRHRERRTVWNHCFLQSPGVHGILGSIPEPQTAVGDGCNGLRARALHLPLGLHLPPRLSHPSPPPESPLLTPAPACRCHGSHQPAGQREALPFWVFWEGMFQCVRGPCSVSRDSFLAQSICHGL